MRFDKRLEVHLKAMQEKDYQHFISTVNLEEATVIMPNGTLIQGKEDVINLHKSWFKDEDWHLSYKIMNTNEGKDFAYALVDIDYKDCDEKGNPIQLKYYLNLIFQKIEKEWLLVQDQNTIHE